MTTAELTDTVPVARCTQNEEALLHQRQINALANLLLLAVLLISAVVGHLQIQSELTSAARDRLVANADAAVTAVAAVINQAEADSLRRTLQNISRDPASAAQYQEEETLMKRCRAIQQPLEGRSACILPGEALLLSSTARINDRSITLVSRIYPADLHSALSRTLAGTAPAGLVLVSGPATQPVLLASARMGGSGISAAATRVVTGQAGSGIEIASDGREYMAAWRPHPAYALGVVATTETAIVQEPGRAFLLSFIALSAAASLTMYAALLLLNKARR